MLREQEESQVWNLEETSMSTFCDIEEEKDPMKGSERSRKGMKELPGYSNAVGIMGISKGCDGI